MNRGVTAGVAVGAVGLGVWLVRAAQADSPPVPRDGFGVADQDVTNVIAVPSGMKCGSFALTVQTSEPPAGFTGACLMDRPYGATVPSVCYSPTGAQYGSADLALPSPTVTTTCTIAASQVQQPDWQIQVGSSRAITRMNAPASYRQFVTCAPHLTTAQREAVVQACTPVGGCPCYTQPVGVNSCCTPFSMAMAPTGDGTTVQGTAFFGMGTSAPSTAPSASASP